MHLPFRIGATSFVYPEGWLQNVERLAGRVRDVEILLFAPDGPGGTPDADEMKALAGWKTRADLTYTVHTPLDVALGSADHARRRESAARVRRVIDLATPLDPFAFVVHAYLEEEDRDRDAWRTRVAASMEDVLRDGVPAERVCLESLDYDFAEVEPVVARLGLSVALDVGHVRRDGRSDTEGLLRRNLARTRVVQWHGVDPGDRDHRSLAFYPRDRAKWLLHTLVEEKYAGVLTLEVFSEPDFEESLSVVDALLREGV